MNQVKAAKREAMADGYADLPDLFGFLEMWRLHHTLTELGAVTQQDPLDLEPDDFPLIKMKPLEEKRFAWAMIALEEEFETPPPGEEWTEENMTRRAWRKQQAEKYGFTQVNTDLKSALSAKAHDDDSILLTNKFSKTQAATALDSARSTESNRNRRSGKGKGKGGKGKTR